MRVEQFLDPNCVGRVPGRPSVPAPRFDVDYHHARVLQSCEVLSYARFAGADDGDNVATRRWSVRRKESENFISRSVAKCCDGGLNISRPGGVVWLGNPRHSHILPERWRKSKNGTLDDTLSIFDNNFYSFY